MIPENLVFLQAVSHEPYFVWQTEVQIVNFRKFGISDRMQIIVWYHKGSTHLPRWMALKRKYSEVNIYFYEDSGVNLGLYIPQLRPHSFKKHFKKYQEELKDKVFFYHDADIIFRELPDFEKLIQDDIVWESNTTGYLDYSYLHRKELQGNIENNEAVKELARIGGITVDTIKSYDAKTGGAQYLLKNIDYNFWEDVEGMCIDIRRSFFHNITGSINNRYFKTEALGFQSWCADMWAVNFSLWKRGIQTGITPELDFSWATDSMETYNKKPIYHNAGASNTTPGVFYKGAWINRSPIGQDISASINSASLAYVNAIKEVKI
jgi:hypothetical protein